MTTPTKRRGRPAIYPFATLAPGQVAFVPGRIPTSLTPLAAYWRRKRGIRFTCSYAKTRYGVSGTLITAHNEDSHTHDSRP